MFETDWLSRMNEIEAAERHFHDRFEAALDALLAEAGGAWTLPEAAEHMVVSEAAVRSMIVKHEALAVVRAERVLLPLVQFASPSAVPATIVDGLEGVLCLFAQAKAGPVGTLEFLITRNPILTSSPIQALRACDARVLDVAAAYLQRDEE